MKKPSRSAAEIIAFHLSEDIAYLRDCRYQPSVYAAMAIYTIDDTYFCCPQAGKKPSYAKEYPWKPVAEHYGRTVYGCTVDEIAAHQGL